MQRRLTQDRKNTERFLPNSRRNSQEFVLRCGPLYLGYKQASRVASIDRAVRFSSRDAAQRCAEELRGGGVFQLPWRVVPASHGSEAA